ncbi:unnamed protein product [Bacillus thuringiensis DB27]|uniref:Integrase catalytic domain-containing protein n=1 Tax=Bacillus thuringiensis DB27 TaxID=1431339 RepID=W8YLQ0_BACTU|nr:unnamed protein product [Bacillus thuringiensis DB27]
MIIDDYYCHFSLSYRDVFEILRKRGISIYPTTTMHWIHEYSNIIYQIWKKKNKTSQSLWRLGDTYIKIEGN